MAAPVAVRYFAQEILRRSIENGTGNSTNGSCQGNCPGGGGGGVGIGAAGAAAIGIVFICWGAFAGGGMPTDHMFQGLMAEKKRRMKDDLRRRAEERGKDFDEENFEAEWNRNEAKNGFRMYHDWKKAGMENGDFDFDEWMEKYPNGWREDGNRREDGDFDEEHSGFDKDHSRYSIPLPSRGKNDKDPVKKTEDEIYRELGMLKTQMKRLDAAESDLQHTNGHAYIKRNDGRLEEGVEDRIEREIARLTKNLPPQYQTLSTLEPLQYNGSMNGNGNGNRSGSFKSKKYPPELRGNSSTVDLEIEDDEKYLKRQLRELQTKLAKMTQADGTSDHHDTATYEGRRAKSQPQTERGGSRDPALRNEL